MLNMNTMKTLGILTVSIALISGITVVSAEEETDYMIPEQSYEVDMDADGATELLTYETYTEETDGFCNAVLKVYLNETLIFDQTEENWSYNWTLDEFTLADGNTYLLACCKSDNDWNEQALILTYSDETKSLQQIADLAKITRESDAENTEEDYSISHWGRCTLVSSVNENMFTVPWTETLMSTGVIFVPVTYEITDGAVSLSEQPYLLDSEQIWTAWHEFDTFTEPGGTESAFHVSADEIVSLTEVKVIDGISYVKCINQSGEEGWYQDPESYISGGVDAEGNYLGGYFREAFFAG